MTFLFTRPFFGVLSLCGGDTGSGGSSGRRNNSGSSSGNVRVM